MTFASPCFASSDEGDWHEWKEAKTLYDEQKFESSLAAFLENPQENASYHYNLGAVYFRLKKLGASLAHFEKANRMHPHDADTQYNLSLVRNSLKQTLSSDQLDPASDWFELIADRLSLEEVRTALGLLGLITTLVWIRVYYKTRDFKKTILHPTALLALAGCIASASVYGLQRLTHSSPPAICIQRESIRSGPGEHYLELVQIEEGVKVRLLGPSMKTTQPHSSDELWHQIRYSEEGIGWMKNSSILAL